jgi:hypothetical protein
MIKTITEKPTLALADGVYKVVDKNGIYWGTYKIVTTWTGARAILVGDGSY